jgi:hypothetical protein
VTFDLAGDRRPGGVQDVMVGQHQVRRDHRPSAVADQLATVVLDQNAADRAGRSNALVEIPGADEVRGVDDGFEQFLARRRVGHLRRTLDRLLDQLVGRGGRGGFGQLVACAVPRDPVQPLRDALGGVHLRQTGR